MLLHAQSPRKARLDHTSAGAYAVSVIGPASGTPLEATVTHRHGLGFPAYGLNRFPARREETCGLSDVDVRNEQPFFTVWLVAKQGPIGTHDRRGGR